MQFLQCHLANAVPHLKHLFPKSMNSNHPHQMLDQSKHTDIHEYETIYSLLITQKLSSYRSFAGRSLCPLNPPDKIPKESILQRNALILCLTRRTVLSC